MIEGGDESSAAVASSSDADEGSSGSGSESGATTSSSSSGVASTGEASSGDESSSSSSSSGGEPNAIGPLTPVTDADDGAIYRDEGESIWYPTGEDGMGRGYSGEIGGESLYYGYLRFELPEPLPADAVIASAVLVLHGHDVYVWNANDAMRVWVQASADAPVVGASHFPGLSVELVDASVRWPEQNGLAWVHPGANRTPDLSPLLQALIDEHGGLEAGAHVQFWIASEVADGLSEEVGWLDSSAGSDTAPSLTIELSL